MGSFNCPITLTIMVDPVILGFSGQSYEKKAIEEWLLKHNTDPISNRVLTPREKVLVPNIALRHAIEEFKNEQSKVNAASATKGISNDNVQCDSSQESTQHAVESAIHVKTKKTKKTKKKSRLYQTKLNIQFVWFAIPVGLLLIVIFIYLCANPAQNIAQDNSNPSAYTHELNKGNVISDDGNGARKIIYEEGVEYEGGTHGDYRHGYGVLKTKLESGSYSVQSGVWVMDELHGECVIEYGNGEVYRGMVSNAKRQGYGVQTSTSGWSQSGTWEADVLHGQSVLKYADGSSYTGEIRNGLRAGYGILTYHDGTIFKGHFTDDLANSQGEQTRPGDYYYKGEFRNGQMTGYGMLKRSGVTLEGYFDRGRPIGNVVAKTADGETFVGGMTDGEGLLKIVKEL